MTKLADVYLIIDTDGQPYVGIAGNFKSRLAQHKKSKRFQKGIASALRLERALPYSAAEKMETFYIKEFDSYKNGLNRTEDGKGLNPGANFTTLGFKYSPESREKMSKSAKARGPNSLGTRHSEETKEMWSKKRKGVVWGPKMFTEEFVQELRDEFDNQALTFTNDFIASKVKPTHIPLVGEVPLEELVQKSGHPLTYQSLFLAYYSEKLGCTKVHIKNIIQRKSYNGAIHHTER